MLVALIVAIALLLGVAALTAKPRKPDGKPQKTAPAGSSEKTKRTYSPSPATGPTIKLKTDHGRFMLGAVGESHYATQIADIDKRHGIPGKITITPAKLVLDDQNPYDNLAVRIEIDGTTVGYLSRNDAKTYRKLLSDEKQGNVIGACRAKIVLHHDNIWSLWLDARL